MRSMSPWKWSKGTPDNPEKNDNQVASFQRAVNTLFDDFFRGFDIPLYEGGKFTPRVDMVEDEKEIKVTAELPGLDEKNIEINLTHDILTIKGEKSEEKEENGKERYFMERSFGSFQRMIYLPTDVDSDKIDASFKKGVLTITMPKLHKEAEMQKKIPIKSA